MAALSSLFLIELENLSYASTWRCVSAHVCVFTVMAFSHEVDPCLDEDLNSGLMGCLVRSD